MFECYRQKISLRFSKHKHTASWARILNVQDIIEERTKETSWNISSTCIPSTTITGAGQHLFNTCLRCTLYRGFRPLPTKFRYQFGPTSQPIADSIVYDAGPTLIRHWVCCTLCANKWHSPNCVSILTHSLRRWPDIETVLGDCIVFSDFCIVTREMLFIPAPETPANTMHWSNADVMLGHHVWRWANIISIKTL